MPPRHKALKPFQKAAVREQCPCDEPKRTTRIAHRHDPGSSRIREDMFHAGWHGRSHLHAGRHEGEVRNGGYTDPCSGTECESPTHVGPARLDLRLLSHLLPEAVDAGRQLKAGVLKHRRHLSN